MGTLQPRAQYSAEELQKLYPRSLQLQYVQIILRHGERTPVKSRFEHIGLAPYWPYCDFANHLRRVILADQTDKQWDFENMARKMETYDKDGLPMLAPGPKGQTSGICFPGELTDVGRKTTLALGRRLRHLYVTQLGFLPSVATHDIFYLRTTPVPRALESLEQAFYGLYPPSARAAPFVKPTVITRKLNEEHMIPNPDACKRLGQLSEAFAARTAEQWNSSPEMAYLTKRIGKYMPGESKVVAVDSRPRLNGVMDTVSSTLAHGRETRLPHEFYDPEVRRILEKINSIEWFSGYEESREYRTLGIGSLAADMTTRMVRRAENLPTVDGEDWVTSQQVKFGLAGAHDTTLAGLISSLGVKIRTWPPFTSHVAVELFKREDPAAAIQIDNTPGYWSTLRGWLLPFWRGSGGPIQPSESIGRKFTPELSSSERARLDNYYVRVRYNDEPLSLPGCATPGNHLQGDESFCTLRAFKAIVDNFTPKNFKRECEQNLDKPPIPERPEPAGYA